MVFTGLEWTVVVHGGSKRSLVDLVRFGELGRSRWIRVDLDGFLWGGELRFNGELRVSCGILMDLGGSRGILMDPGESGRMLMDLEDPRRSKGSSWMLVDLDESWWLFAIVMDPSRSWRS